MGKGSGLLLNAMSSAAETRPAPVVHGSQRGHLYYQTIVSFLPNHSRAELYQKTINNVTIKYIQNRTDINAIIKHCNLSDFTLC